MTEPQQQPSQPQQAVDAAAAIVHAGKKVKAYEGKLAAARDELEKAIELYARRASGVGAAKGGGEA